MAFLSCALAYIEEERRKFLRNFEMGNVPCTVLYNPNEEEIQNVGYFNTYMKMTAPQQPQNFPLLCQNNGETGTTISGVFAQNPHNVSSNLSSKRKLETKKNQDHLNKKIKTADNTQECEKQWFKCPMCLETYAGKEYLKQHLKEHNIDAKFICDICGALIKNKHHYKRHKEIHDPDKQIPCSMCPKKFKRNEHLRNHLLTHSGEKNEICKTCGKAFVRKDHLRNHERTHTRKTQKQEKDAGFKA